MILHWFRSLRSFADKVTLLLTLTSGVAVVAVCCMLAAADYYYARAETLAALRAQTMMAAMNSSAPLAFSDATNANEALSAFQTSSAIASALLYDAGGRVFAAYRRPAAGAAAGEELPQAIFGESFGYERVPVIEKGQRLGTLEVAYDLSGLQGRLWRALAWSLLATMVAVLLVYLFSLRIRRLLITPITLLGDTARRISQTRDYSQRARKISDDELGTFTDTFNQMLEQIQKQDVEIQNSRAEALQANRLKDEFLATLSHELRTPLAPIVGWAQVLRLSADGNLKMLQAADVIERNARVQNKIIDDLLDMSRIVSGKVKLEVRRLDLADVVRDSVEIVAPSAAAKGIALEQRIEHGVAHCNGDPHRLQQVIWNLLSNAIKFTAGGGTVRIALHRIGDQIQLAVTDTGAGIAAEFLPHVFERFRQADSTNTRRHTGLGLGLAIVKHLVELHGGSAAVFSAGVGQGATFTVALPAAPETAPAPSATAAVHGAADGGVQLASLQGCSVLLVDDEQDARDLIEQVLRMAGARVLACGSVAAALGAIDDFAPDVLLSDIAMPEASGYGSDPRRARVAFGTAQCSSDRADRIRACRRPQSRTRRRFPAASVQAGRQPCAGGSGAGLPGRRRAGITSQRPCAVSSRPAGCGCCGRTRNARLIRSPTGVRDFGTPWFRCNCVA